MQLVVLGMHRSGTSLLAHLLALMGCHVGENSVATGPWNPSGHWEHPQLVALDEDILVALGAVWYDVLGLDLAKLPAAEHTRFRERAVQLVSQLDVHRPWVIKDPRLCALLPFWRPLLASPVVILAHRDPVAVARSVRARDGFPLSLGIALWEQAMRAALVASAGLPRVRVRHAELLRDADAVAGALFRQLADLGVAGLRRPDLAGLVEPGLKHHEAEEAERDGLLNSSQIELCAALDRGDLGAAQEGVLSEGAADLLALYPSQLRRLEVAQLERDELRARMAIEAELHAWVADLERAKTWLESQRARWQAEAEALARVVEAERSKDGG